MSRRRGAARRARSLAAALASTAFLSCGGPGESSDARTIVVFNAGSLARPLRAALDSFAAAAHVTVEQENAGSLETARKLTELGNTPDIVALADYEVFPTLLMPAHATWFAEFARNRMVLAHSPRSRGLDSATAETWLRVVLRPGIETGYADPNLDPAGYRTLLLFQLAERHYGAPGLAARLRTHIPVRNVRPKSADLVALLQTGELDYAFEYESVAQGAALPYVVLPSRIDLGSPAESTFYSLATVRVAGATPSDTLDIRGQPIRYAFSIPSRAPHPAIAEQFALFLLSPDGRRIMRRERLDVLEDPTLVGSGAPAALGAALARKAAGPPHP